jgi:hypothetical protein
MAFEALTAAVDDCMDIAIGVVEQRGIEPLTSALRTPRSPN